MFPTNQSKPQPLSEGACRTVLKKLDIRIYKQCMAYELLLAQFQMRNWGKKRKDIQKLDNIKIMIEAEEA